MEFDWLGGESIEFTSNAADSFYYADVYRGYIFSPMVSFQDVESTGSLPTMSRFRLSIISSFC